MSKWPFTSDSAEYLQAAESFLAGAGFMVIPRGITSYGKDAVPLASFPIGYPAIIAAVSSLGVKTNIAGIWIAQVSWMLLPLALVFTLRRVIGASLAVAIALLISLSPGIVTHGYKAITDVPFLVITIFSVGVLIRAFNVEKENALTFYWLLPLSGFLAGIAYSIRNVGVALLLAVGFAFVMSIILRLLTPREAGKRFMLWLTGLIPIVGFLWIRNLYLFEALNPYSRPPSSHGFWHNIQAFLVGLGFDLTSQWSFSQLFWQPSIAIVFCAIGLLLICLGLRKYWTNYDLMARFTVLIMASYLLAGSTVIIIGATLYQIEEIGLRFVMQYGWLVLAILALAIGAKQWPATVSKAIGVSAVIVFLLLGHIQNMHHYLTSEPQPKWLLSKDESLIEMVQSLPKQAVLFSNNALFLSIETGRKVRHLPANNVEGLKQSLTKIYQKAVRLHSNRSVYYLLLPLSFKRANFDPKFINRSGLDNVYPHFKLINKTSHIILFHLNLEKSKGMQQRFSRYTYQ